MKLNAKAIGLAAAVISAVLWFLMMSFSLITNIGEITMTELGSYHPGFSYSWLGMVVVVIESFVYNFIIGYAFAWFYNKFSK